MRLSTLRSYLLFAYILEFPWLQELLLVTVIVTLQAPLGFFDVFIQKLFEYNTFLAEDRQLLNAAAECSLERR